MWFRCEDSHEHTPSLRSALQVCCCWCPRSAQRWRRLDAADAVQKKDLGALRALVQRKADVNAAQPDGTTALHWAVVWNNDEAVNLLLRAGADVKAGNRYGATPLVGSRHVWKRGDGRRAAQGRRRRRRR